MRSLLLKHIQDLLSDYKFDLVAVTETWLNIDIKQKYFSFVNFETIAILSAKDRNFY